MDIVRLAVYGYVVLFIWFAFSFLRFSYNDISSARDFFVSLFVMAIYTLLVVGIYIANEKHVH